MGAITIYAFYVALLLAVFYLVYKWTLASATFFRFNRRVLMGCYALSLLGMPLYDALTAMPDAEAAGGVNYIMEEISMLSDTPAPEWPKVLALVYAVGVVAATVFTGRSIFRIMRVIRRGEHTQCDGYTLVVADSGYAPFSWGRYIVLPTSVADTDMQLIIEHERCHLRHRHWIDLAVAQVMVIFNWFNPAAYLLAKEVQDVHEFEVDNDIVAMGYDEKKYQMLLLRNAVAAGAHRFVDSLTHSRLKARIKMMMSTESRASRRIFAGILLPAVLLVVAGVRNSALAEPLSMIDSASVFAPQLNEVSYSIVHSADGSEAHAIAYTYEGNVTSVKIDLPKNTPAPRIYINGHLSSRAALGALRAGEIEFIVGDNLNNRFILKTK